MPFKNEHACRLVDPAKFQPNSFRRLNRVSNGKDLGVIIGRLKGKTTTTDQAFRYPIKDWTEGAARKHCREHQGILFEPAVKDDDSGAGSFLPNIAARVFDTPLLIDANKLNAILAVLGRRIGLDDLRALEIADPEPPRPFRLFAGGVAVIPVTGTLVHRSFGLHPLSGFTNYVGIEETFLDAIDDAQVNAIVFDIDSPGGEANGVFDLSDTIHAARGTKPIWAVANETALSAAYAIASAADRVVVPRTGALGSVGVLAVHIDQSEKDRKEGLKFSFMTGGARKADGNPHLPLDDEARSTIQAEVDRVFDLFVDTVARNRQLSPAVIREMEGESVFGPDAASSGLADEVGTFKESMKALTRRLQRLPAMAAANTRKDRIMIDNEDHTIDDDDIPANDNDPDPAPEAPGNVVNIDDARAEARAETALHASQIVELCALAGKPTLAAKFITEQTPLEKVREALLAGRADGEDEIVSKHTGQGAEMPQPRIDAGEIYRSRAEQTHR